MAKIRTKSSKTKPEKDTEYLTKRNLVRAIKKGMRSELEEALTLKGNIVTIEKGWLVRLGSDGSKHKISKLEVTKRPKHIVLD